jgi:hypothetical protein
LDTGTPSRNRPPPNITGEKRTDRMDTMVSGKQLVASIGKAPRGILFRPAELAIGPSSQ